MELYQLRSFAAVAELGHLTRAAEKLHISQPALSAQIKALEDELGVALFERVSSGMVLTSAGRKLLPEAQKVVAAAQVVAQPRPRHQGRGRRTRARRHGVGSGIHARRRVSRACARSASAARDRDSPRGDRRSLRESARRHARRELLLRQPRRMPTWPPSRSSISPIASSRPPPGPTASSTRRGTKSLRCRGSWHRRSAR